MVESILDKGLDEIVKLKEAVAELGSLELRKKNVGAEIKLLDKEIKAGTSHMESEIDKAIRSRRSVIENKYKKQIDELVSKKNSILSKRNKTKKSAISERIKGETTGATKEMKRLKDERKALYRLHKIPVISRNRFFSALYMPKGFKDFLIILAVLVFVLFLIPCGIYFLWLSDKSYLFLALLYILSILIFGGLYLLLNKVKNKNAEGLLKLRELRIAYNKNKREKKKIKKGILKDTDESRYGLSSYDEELRAVNTKLDSLNKEKNDALEYFESNTRPLITNEITMKLQPAVDRLSALIKKERDKLKATETEYNKLSLNLANNYEAYIGKEFMTVDKLAHLETIMREKNLSSIRDAIDYVKAMKS
ncbi:MAG: hypothetical protein R3232_06250 [Clostridia bacterium]|nr:hypothetical protein [Clostridia bacterium]